MAFALVSASDSMPGRRCSPRDCLQHVHTCSARPDVSATMYGTSAARWQIGNKGDPQQAGKASFDLCGRIYQM